MTFPVDMWSDRLPSSKKITDVMGGFSGSIYPHLKFTDAAVLNTYEKACMRLVLQPDNAGCDCQACSVRSAGCRDCHAKFGFKKGDYKSMKGVVQLIVERNFDPTNGFADPNFVSQLECRTER